MKFPRPYYADFSVFDRLGKVLKTFNFQKFSKKKSMLRFTLWNHSCFKKQSYIRSSKYVVRDFPKALRHHLKNMIFNFSTWRFFSVFEVIQFRRAAMVRCVKPFGYDWSLRLSSEFLDAPTRQCVGAWANAPMRQSAHAQNCREFCGMALICPIQEVLRIRQGLIARMSRHRDKIFQGAVSGDSALGLLRGSGRH